MTQSFNLIISTLTGLALLSWTGLSSIRAIKANADQTKQYWHTEFKSHECGRAVAALANLSSAAYRISRSAPKQKSEIDSALTLANERLLTRYLSKYSFSGRSCMDAITGKTLAEAYLLNADDAREVSGQFSYRILPQSLVR